VIAAVSRCGTGELSFSQVVEQPRNLRMVGTERLLADRQRSLVGRLGVGVARHPSIRSCSASIKVCNPASITVHRERSETWNRRDSVSAQDEDHQVIRLMALRR
jgi:hypothetical protein